MEVVFGWPQRYVKFRDVSRQPLWHSGFGLRPYPDDDPDRKRVLDGAAESQRDEGQREPGGVSDDSVQGDGECIEELAIVRRFATPGLGRPGDRFNSGIKENAAT